MVDVRLQIFLTIQNIGRQQLIQTAILYLFKINFKMTNQNPPNLIRILAKPYLLLMSDRGCAFIYVINPLNYDKHNQNLTYKTYKSGGICTFKTQTF